MGKPTSKKRSKPSQNVTKSKQSNAHQEKTSKAFDEDTTVFINMAKVLKEEGNSRFQKRDIEGAMLKYEKALKLLPNNHINVASIHTNMASCFMQMGVGEYHQAIHECNLALEVSPKFSKALLKRSRCYEALNRFEWALRDVNTVLSVEPNNLTALEIRESVQKSMAEKGVSIDDKLTDPGSQELDEFVPPPKAPKEKVKKKKSRKIEHCKVEDSDKFVEVENEKKVAAIDVVDKVVVVKAFEEKEMISMDLKSEEVVSRSVKLALGEDIRWAQLPMNCNVRLLRDVVCDRFPGLKGVLIKYKDHEGDFITITTTEELRLAESTDPHGSLKFYIVEVDHDQEPEYECSGIDEVMNRGDKTPSDLSKRENSVKDATCIDDWIIQFARLFKNHVGFSSDAYLELHQVGMKVYSEAMEDTVTSEQAQELLDVAADKFQEMAALALFNWGNVHMTKARKQVIFTENGSKDSLLLEFKSAYEWALKEYVKAGAKYQEAVKIKPDFYEGFLALGQQQFEQAKLCWSYAIGSKVDLQGKLVNEVLNLYNKAEDSMEMGMQTLEVLAEQRLNGLSKIDKFKKQLQKVGLNEITDDQSVFESPTCAANMTSQIYLVWGTMLYERSIVEYKLELPTWEECLEVAVEKFELAGASQTDIAVMIKNHCSNVTAVEGLGFKIDEIVQAWNEMYDVKREIGIPAIRSEPLFCRQFSKLHHILEQV